MFPLGNSKQLRQLISLQDRERQLLACEIHDGFVQEVMGAQLAVDALLERLVVSDPESVEPLLRARAMIRKAIDEARRLVGELRLPADGESNLVQGVQSLVHEIETRRQMEVTLTHQLSGRPLDPLLQSTIVRIVQESLNNVSRHARTRSAQVDLLEKGDTIRVTISDRGMGFNAQQIPPNCFGLTGIRERARLFGGKATVRSRPGEGTRITVEFPIAADSET